MSEELKPWVAAHAHEGPYGWEIFKADSHERLCGDMTEAAAKSVLAALNSPAPAVQVPEGYVSTEDVANFISAEGPHIHGSQCGNAECERRCDKFAVHCEKLDCEAMANAIREKFAAPAPSTVVTEAVAQGGGVDVEKVMALVEEYGLQRRYAGENEAVGHRGSASENEKNATAVFNQIRALLSASPAASGEMAVNHGPMTEENTTERLEDMLMECVERMANFPAETIKIDKRAWEHLLVYAPAVIVNREPK